MSSKKPMICQPVNNETSTLAIANLNKQANNFENYGTAYRNHNLQNVMSNDILLLHKEKAKNDAYTSIVIIPGHALDA
ncbi:hypothetical protein KUTeg_022980 [Tegillarca granosa]|uniref:Uncharacterized protein n=1 Tax=Tegillarca granosa TaxID=220873 RepID=A0ABQ9E5Z0_TEGGR|nr:hypothetical protein KUTeg_022980 [Tegillarca granosa]